MNGVRDLFWLVLILLGSTFHDDAQAWSWFSSSPSPLQPEGGRPSYEYYDDDDDDGIAGSAFDIEAVDNPKGRQLVENARKRLASSYRDNLVSYSCWQKAYSKLFSTCKEIMQDDEKKSRLAWHLSECFQKESGRRPLPYCHSSSLMINCLKQLDDAAHKVYLAFFIDTSAMCQHLQSHAFKQDAERVVNELKTSAHWVVDKLGKIEEQSDSLLEHSNLVHHSLNSIESQAQAMAEKSKVVENKIVSVMDQSKAIFEQSHQIIDTQSKLREEQVHMQNTLDTSMADIHKSYISLGEGIGFLQKWLFHWIDRSSFWMVKVWHCKVLIVLLNFKQKHLKKADYHYNILLMALVANSLNSWHIRKRFNKAIIAYNIAPVPYWQPRDYEVLNYRMLLDIQHKLYSLESILDKNQVGSYNKGSKLMERDQNASQQLFARTIVNRAALFQRQRSTTGSLQAHTYIQAELEEDESSDDPDYELPLDARENFSLIPKTYNLRSHSHG